MDTSPESLAKIHAQHQRITYDFLKAELLTCFTAIDFGKTQMKLGYQEFAEHEAHEAEKGYRTIGHFLPQLEGDERGVEIQTKRSHLLKALNAFRLTLGLGTLDSDSSPLKKSL